jgi:hypothetical protein
MHNFKGGAMRPLRVLAGGGAASLVIVLGAMGAYANVALAQISSDSFTNTTSQHKTEVEPDTFSFGSTIVSAFQEGRFFNGGASGIGFSTSTNGGKTFTSGTLPAATVSSTPPGPYDRASDASVAFDAKHGVWLISWLGLITPNPAVESSFKVDVLVSRSTNGGKTWSAPVAVDAPGTQFFDKNWTTCDDAPASRFYGNCYTEFDNAGLNDLVQMSTSSDGGLTWGPALGTSNHTLGLGGQPLVRPDGTVVVPIVNAFETTMLSFVSTDGGASWSITSVISDVRDHANSGGLRTSPLPTAEIDAAGNVYVAWQDCRFRRGCSSNDIVLSTSSDGVHWSPVSRVPIDPVTSGADHFIPGLGVDRSTAGMSAHLGLTYYFYPSAACTAATCQLDVGFISSTNGGSTWSVPTQLAGPMSLDWLPSTNQGVMVGDYIATSILSGEAWGPFALGSAPSGGLFDEAMFVPNGGLPVTGGTTPAADPVVSTSSDHPASAAPLTAQ